ncbi:hypothetical protein AB1Y20_023295 [Prymnesium parvum]|uniref:Transaldolase n=1 Tax=Prymnesium parvum TaxID=97485 RepID=A0AB34JFS8_PRYPA
MLLLAATAAASWGGASRPTAAHLASTPRRARAGLPPRMGPSQLAQLAAVTTLSIDTGDLAVIEAMAATGYITDATTNPLFVSQAGLSGDPKYAALVDEAVAYAKAETSDTDDAVALAMDRLAVNLGCEIVKLVDGYVSTEVDPRLSFNVEESLKRARRIIGMYEAAGVPRSRILIKLAGTWEGLRAMEQLEKEGITCNITLVFGFLQAVAAAQFGARLISPFPGRIKDWHAAAAGEPAKLYEPEEDPGVLEVRRMYAYYKRYGHETICMPASWRPSRGKGFELDEIMALAGTDRMTIPPALLERLNSSEEELPRKLSPELASHSCADEELAGGYIDEPTFRFLLNQDGCTTEKMAEGIRSFVSDTEKLEAAIRQKLAA